MTDFTGLGLLSLDVQRLARFYRDVLGARIEDNDVHCEVNLGGIGFPIYNPHKHKGAQEIFKDFAGSSLWLAFGVEDVDAEYERIIGLGVEGIVSPGGRLIIGSYTEEKDDNSFEEKIRALGFVPSGYSRRSYGTKERKILWIDREA